MHRLILLRCAKLAPGNVRLHLLGVEGEGLSEVGFRFLGAASLPFQDGQIDPSGDQVGAQLDRALAACRVGLELTALFAQQAAEIHPGGGKVGALYKGATIASFGLFELAHTKLRTKAGGKFGFRKMRAKRKSLPVAVECLFMTPHAGKRGAESQMRRNRRRLTAKSQGKLPNRLFGSADGELQFAQAHTRQNIGSVEAE